MTTSFVIRTHRPGDWGWIVSRHGALYAEEYGWNIEFEAMVAQIAHDFIAHFKVDREACWIAERDGANVGAVALVEQSKTVAKLRTLIVDPSARGLGVGKALVEESERFARAAGYKKIVLWTNDVLTAARHIYERAGYRLVRSEPHHSFGVDLVGEYWEKRL
jgi:GNAT superfamily N-acetyltransferase